MNPTRVGVDLAKSVLQIHSVDRHEKVVARKKLNRAQMHTYVKSLAPCLVGMEACATSHYWARTLMSYGHRVELIAAQFVKPYVKSGKNDANDAEAICEAVGRANDAVRRGQDGRSASDAGSAPDSEPLGTLENGVMQ